MVPVMMTREEEGTRETRVFARGNRMSKEDAVKPGRARDFSEPEPRET